MRGLGNPGSTLSLRRDRDACKLFEAALRRDNRDIEALIGLALYHTNDLRTFASTNRDEQLCIAEKANAHRGARTCSGSALTQFVTPDGVATARYGAVAARVRTRDHAGSQSSLAHADAGFMKVLLGRAEEAEADLTNAVRLEPAQSGARIVASLIGIADLFLAGTRQHWPASANRSK